MKVGFIYPQWMNAKRRLVEALYEAPSKEHIALIVDEWMRKHLFEVGVTTQVAHLDMYKGQEEDMERHLKSMAARKIAEDILSKDMYMREMNYDRRDPWVFPSREYTYSILIGAVVDITGPGTREGKLLSIEEKR